ncbi:lactate racemase domain-containing protein [Acidobacteriota bacterium]
MNLPKMALIEQKVDSPYIVDVEQAVLKELERFNPRDLFSEDCTVAVTAGSRKIADIAKILQAVITFLTDLGCKPFIVPSMGSHGGGSADGQVAVLRNYGISRKSMGVPIESGTDVEQIGTTEDGVPVYLDKIALSADHIVVVNRVKPHTMFFGKVESGLTKMTLVGLGNREGASVYHRANKQHGFDRVAETAFRIVRDKASVTMGLAIVEGAEARIAHLEAVAPDDFLDTDDRLRQRADELMLKLPIETADLLIVDQMGKDLSGTGMDVNVTGRREDSSVKIDRIFVRDLTDGSKGNAHGVGLSQVVTQRLVDKINMEVTLANAKTALREDAAQIPPSFDTDRECLEEALEGIETPDARIIHIRDTLHIKRCLISKALLPEVEERSDLEILSPLKQMQFDDEGNLLPVP